MTTDKNSSPVTAPMWWDGGDRAITAREKATIEEHGPSCFSIALVPATPSARWAADGLPDPHAGRYACERAALTLGNLTDDELANAVYLHGNEQPSMADLVAGKALSGIVYLTAAKDRIRWLSRALAATCKQPLQVGEVQGDARSLAEHITDHLCHHEYDIGGRSELLACVTEALAARQPGAQKPVGLTGAFLSDVVTAAGLVSTGGQSKALASRISDEAYRLLPLVSAAPPAQGVDLGQFLPHTTPVIDKLQDVMATHGFAVPVRVISDAFRTALNEQRDAAQGVASA